MTWHQLVGTQLMQTFSHPRLGTDFILCWPEDIGWWYSLESLCIKQAVGCLTVWYCITKQKSLDIAPLSRTCVRHSTHTLMYKHWHVNTNYILYSTPVTFFCCAFWSCAFFFKVLNTLQNRQVLRTTKQGKHTNQLINNLFRFKF